MPLSLTEGMGDSVKWRDSPDEGASLRLSLLLKSFIKYFKQEDLHTFFLVCPPNQVKQVSLIVHSITSDPRYLVISEWEICPEVFKFLQEKKTQISGWYLQQILKLAMAERIQTSHFLLFDSDIICLRPFDLESIVPGGRALLNIETKSDYQRLYTPQFAVQEFNLKIGRYSRACQLLSYQRPEEQQAIIYGETPVLMHTQSVKDLKHYIESKTNLPSGISLILRLPWTEYSLYFMFLEKYQRIEAIYEKKDCNTLLDLEKSVWQGNSRYKQRRVYDKKHFHDQENCGYFVAIQSWLKQDTWLPEEFENLEDFYLILENWVLS